MLRKIGRSCSLAAASASGPHGYQSTGLWACWRRYGLVSPARRLAMGPMVRGRGRTAAKRCAGAPLTVGEWPVEVGNVWCTRVERDMLATPHGACLSVVRRFSAAIITALIAVGVFAPAS